MNIHTLFYHRTMEEIRSRLGGRCSCCGSKLKLVVDHIRGRNYESRALSSNQRARVYLKELNDGVPLRLLCKDCDPNQGRGCGSRECPGTQAQVGD